MTTPGISAWRRFPSDPADWFSPDEIAKARAYSSPSRRLYRMANVAGVAVELFVVLSFLAPRLLRALHVTNWVEGVIVVVASASLIDLVHAVPFAAYRQLRFDKQAGFSTQTVKGFIGDTVKNLLIELVLGALLTIPIWWAIRTTDLWWVLGWLLLAAFEIVALFLAPVILMPLFNKFKPLEDDDLRADLLSLARQVDVPVQDVLVFDGSKRDTRENAFFAGLGKTRRLVLFDTILGRPREQLRSVIAHELGHWKLRHLVVTLPASVVSQFVAFFVLYEILRWRPLLDLAGVRSLRDPGAIPLFGLVFGVVNRLPSLIQTKLTQVHEREADRFALETLRDPDAFIETMRALHVDNLVNLTPSWWLRFSRDHPYADERMAMAAEWARRAGVPVSASH
jgi:STE24 endopeptidase